MNWVSPDENNLGRLRTRGFGAEVTTTPILMAQDSFSKCSPMNETHFITNNLNRAAQFNILISQILPTHIPHYVDIRRGDELLVHEYS